jgi:T-complex protein 1 subunit beta
LLTRGCASGRLARSTELPKLQFIHDLHFPVASSLQVADIEKAEREKMADKCQRIIGHGINCFVNRQLIYNFPEQIFADAGVMAIEHADFDGIERLALVTGKPCTDNSLVGFGTQP